jgi:hypothetical protein
VCCCWVVVGLVFLFVLVIDLGGSEGGVVDLLGIFGLY